MNKFKTTKQVRKMMAEENVPVYTTDTEEFAGAASIFSTIEIVDEAELGTPEPPVDLPPEELPMGPLTTEDLARFDELGEEFGSFDESDASDEPDDFDDDSTDEYGYDADELDLEIMAEAEVDEADKQGRSPEEVAAIAEKWKNVLSERAAEEEAKKAEKVEGKNAEYIRQLAKDAEKAAMRKPKRKPNKVEPAKMTSSMRRRYEQEQAQRIRREAQAKIEAAREGEQKFVRKMYSILAPAEQKWVQDEHFRLLCGSGIDESYIYLGFRAMLLALDKPEAVRPKKRKGQTFGAQAGCVFAEDKARYVQFLIEHIATLDAQLKKCGRKRLSEDVWKHREVFLDSERDAWPLRIAKILSYTPEETSEMTAVMD